MTEPSPNSTTVTPGNSSAPIKFQVTAAGPFQGTVNLSCSELPSGASCSFLPSSAVQPTSNTLVSVILTIEAQTDATAGQFTVSITGSIPDGPIKTQALTLTVTKDYSLSISNPSQTAYQNAIATFQGSLTSLNGYANQVNLSCGSGTPPTCSVAPATVTPTADGTEFTVNVSSDQCGQYNFNVVAKGADPLGTTHSFPIVFTSQSLAPPNYTVALNNPSLTTNVNAPTVFSGSLTGTACYGYAVQLTCGSGAPPTCSISPASPVPSASGTPFSVKVSSGNVQKYNFTISAVGSDPNKIEHVALASLDVVAPNNSDFSFTDISGSESVTAGNKATFDLSVTPSNGKFPHSVALSYSACPPVSTCVLTPTSINSGSGITTAHLTVQTTAPIAASARRRDRVFYGFLLFGPMFFALGGMKSRRRLVGFIVTFLIFLTACGGGHLEGGSTASAQPGTPTGVCTMNVTAAMDSGPTKTLNVTLTVN